MSDDDTPREDPPSPTATWQRKRMLRFRVIPSEEGQTLRQLLVRRLPGIGKEEAAELIRAGGILVNGLRVRVPTVRVAPGERLTVHPHAAEVPALTRSEVVLVVRDDSFVIVDKPAGVPVTPTKESARGTVVEGLIDLLRAEGVLRPYVGVVHRLDQGASGLVLCTIRSVANASLHRQFVAHEVKRTYRLRCHGDPPDACTCEQPLEKLRDGGVRVVAPGTTGALTARTHFRKLATVPGEHGPEHLVEATLDTGRTHQIRAHAAHLGFPIVGDHRYGPTTHDLARSAEEPIDYDRLCLHASRLEFAHPFTGARVVAESPVPGWGEAGA